MALPVYLAMTPWEMANAPTLPGHCAWMACHFSQQNPGLSNLPHRLPEGSILVLDDLIPPEEHDPALVVQQLTQCVEQWSLKGVILDLQRLETPETQALAQAITAALPCPVAAPPAYVCREDQPIFLPPIPPYIPKETYLIPWQHRRIWLELAWDCTQLTLTTQGCRVDPTSLPEQKKWFYHQQLCCHYAVEIQPQTATFTLFRNTQDTHRLLENLGIEAAVGLYQQHNQQLVLFDSLST